MGGWLNNFFSSEKGEPIRERDLIEDLGYFFICRPIVSHKIVIESQAQPNQ